MKTTITALTISLLLSSTAFTQTGETLVGQPAIDVTDVTGSDPIPSSEPKAVVSAPEVAQPDSESNHQKPLTAPLKSSYNLKSSTMSDISPTLFASNLKETASTISNALAGTCIGRVEVQVAIHPDGKIVIVSDKSNEGSMKLIFSNKLSESCK